jgi:hypothetical protein
LTPNVSTIRRAKIIRVKPQATFALWTKMR